MAGTTAGGLKASRTTKKRYGKNFFRKNGAEGGKKSRGGGFASLIVGADGLTGPERARLVNKKRREQ